MEQKQTAKSAILLIVIAGIMWGTSCIFVHYLSPYGFSSLQMTAARGGVSAIAILLFSLIRNRKVFRARPLDLFLYLLIGLCLFLTSYLYYSSIQLTTSATAAMLMGISPVYAVLISTLFLGEKLSKWKTVSIVGILVGGVLVSGVIGNAKFNVFGVLMGIASGVSYAVYNILTKICMRRGCEPGSATLYGFLVMAVVAIAVSNPGQIPSLAMQKPLLLIPLLSGLGIVTFVIPYFLYTVSLKNLSVGVASALGTIEPLSATLFSIFLFNEQPTVFSAIGIVLVLVFVVLLSRHAED